MVFYFQTNTQKTILSLYFSFLFSWKGEIDHYQGPDSLFYVYSSLRQLRVSQGSVVAVYIENR